jgi:hypothetical protein
MNHRLHWVLLQLSLSLFAVNAAYGENVQPATGSPDKIHFLLLSDVDDAEIGPGVAANERFLIALFKNQAGAKLGSLVSLRSPQLSIARISSTIASLSVGKNDALLCYVSEHGGYQGTTEATHFFQFPGGGNGAENVLRSDLFSSLKGRGARLTVLISDSCFSSAGPEPIARFAAPAAPLTQTNPLYFLLRRFRGDVDINASSPAHFAIYLTPGPGTSDRMIGGVFTRAFYKTSLYSSNAGSNVDWSHFFIQLTKDTAEEFGTDFPNGVQLENPPVFESTQVPFRFAR